MFAAAFRFLTLLALVLMPVGMSSSSALAAQPAAHASMADAGFNHCGDQDGKSSSGTMPVTHCGGTCSALPLGAVSMAEVVPAPVAIPAPAELSGPDSLAHLPAIPPPRMV